MDWSLGTGIVAEPFRMLPAAPLLAALDGRGPFALFETSRAGRDGDRSFLFTDPEKVITTTRSDELGGCLRHLEEALDSGLWAAGFISYEAGYFLEPSLPPKYAGRFPLLWFALFREPFVFDHRSGSFSPSLPFPLEEGSAPPSFSVRDGHLNIGREEYRSAVSTIRERIAAGDTYQVNFTMKYRFRLEGSPAGLYLSLRENQPVPFGACIRTGERDILSASPELFFRIEGERITARPMKGTAARGRTGREDILEALRLAVDGKNRAENIMIVDLIRNDLGRICRPGSIEAVDICRVEPYDTLFQMTSTVRGELRGKTAPGSLIKALFPCGSVTGAPKIKTMEIIAGLEKEERGVYCGAVGYLSPRGEGAFSVPIRTAVIDAGGGEMGVGSGIVADSEAEAEYEECLLKGAFLTSPRPPLRLIETLRWQAGEGFRHLEDHLARLFSSAVTLGFACPVPEVRRSLEAAVAGSGGKSPRRVRLLLDRGGACEISIAPIDPPPPGTPVVRLSPATTDSADPYLYYKTTRREIYDRELAAAREEGYFEVLFTNERGEITEGSFTSIFVEGGGEFLTPPRSSGLLDGILRRRLLREEPGRLSERVLRHRDLLEAERLFVGNSLRGLIEVNLAAPGESPGRRRRGRG